MRRKTLGQRFSFQTFVSRREEKDEVIGEGPYAGRLQGDQSILASVHIAMSEDLVGVDEAYSDANLSGWYVYSQNLNL